MRRISQRVAVALLVVGLSSGTAVATGPDFARCADTGEAFGQCVADIAREFHDADDDMDTAEAARGLVESCAAFSGEQFGVCVSEAAHGLHAREEPPGATVSEAARSLVDGCRDQEGAAFGACVRAGAHELGNGAGAAQPADDDQATGSGKPAHAGKPQHSGKPTGSGDPDDGEKQTQRGKPAHAGKPSSSASHGSGGRRP